MAKVKIPFKKKSKNKKASVGEESPLMADAGADGADAQRELRRKERDERRKERSERRAQTNPTSVNPALDRGVESKKKNKPKIPREEQMLKDAKLGCCHKFGTLLVKLVHVLDALIGLTFIIYGSLILTQFEEPAMEAAITTLTYGSIMLFASIMGVVGFYSSRCKRAGLLISAYSSPIIVLCNIFAMIFELSSSSSIFDYLTEHMDVLYLDEAEIATLKKILPFFFVVLASLTAIEICRFLLLSQLRERLVRFDSANRHISSSNSVKSSKAKSSEKSSKGVGLARTVLSDSLLDDEEANAMGRE